MPTSPLARFKSAVRAGDPVNAAVTLHKTMATRIVAEADDRRVKYIISNSSVDREKDVVDVRGWDLTAFLRNPVVLWGHKSAELPIGKCVAIGIEDDDLAAVVEYVPADMPEVGPRAEAVLRMSRSGFLSATSVGFRPLEFALATDRMSDDDWWPPIDFLRQELMEFSIVSIPCNPEALIDPAARSAAAADPALDALARDAAAAPGQIAATHARSRRLALLRAYA